MHYKEAIKLATELEKDVFETLDYFNRAVQITHEDGATLFFRSAVVVVLSKDYFAVYTEHHGTMVYHVEDAMYMQMSIEYKVPRCSRGKMIAIPNGMLKDR